MDEKIIKVERMCKSLWAFPSGTLSVLTWTLFGSTVRHEYIIITTEKNVILIEVSGDEGINIKKGALIVVKVF